MIRLSRFIMGFVLFSMVIAGFSGLAAHLASNYGVVISSDLSSLNQINEYNSYALDMQDSLNNPFAGLAGLDVLYTTVVTGYSALQGVFNMMTSVTSLILSINGLIPLPGWFVDGVSTFVIFTMCLGLVGVLIGRDI